MMETNAGRLPYSLTWDPHMDGNIAISTFPKSFAEVKGFNTCIERTTLGVNPDPLIESLVSYCDHYEWSRKKIILGENSMQKYHIQRDLRYNIISICKLKPYSNKRFTQSEMVTGKILGEYYFNAQQLSNYI
jgi:hypothetical protein